MKYKLCTIGLMVCALSIFCGSIFFIQNNHKAIQFVTINFIRKLELLREKGPIIVDNHEFAFYQFDRKSNQMYLKSQVSSEYILFSRIQSNGNQKYVLDSYWIQAHLRGLNEEDKVPFELPKQHVLDEQQMNRWLLKAHFSNNNESRERIIQSVDSAIKDL